MICSWSRLVALVCYSVHQRKATLALTRYADAMWDGRPRGNTLWATSERLSAEIEIGEGVSENRGARSPNSLGSVWWIPT